MEFLWDLFSQVKISENLIFHQLKNQILADFDMGKEFLWEFLHVLKNQTLANFDLRNKFPWELLHHLKNSIFTILTLKFHSKTSPITPKLTYTQ